MKRKTVLVELRSVVVKGLVHLQKARPTIQEVTHEYFPDLKNPLMEFGTRKVRTTTGDVWIVRGTPGQKHDFLALG